MRLLSWLLWAAAAIVPVISTEETNLSRLKRESSEKRIVCYYTNWSVYRPGTAKFSPQNINPYLCTHLIYAFGGLTKDNALKPFDKYQDIEQGGYAKFNGLKTYNKNLKTMVAIGGWNEGSARFSPLVADPERRKELVKNTVRFLRQNHFDGLDLDWEYPSFRDGGKPRDRENYATLVQEFREEFDRESEKTGRTRLLLTMAVPAGIEYIDKGYDVKKLNKYLDWMNILSYDYHSAFEPAVNHHSPLFSLEEDDEYNLDAQLNIDHTVQHYIKLGADRNKLVLGIPTYGRSYTLFNPDATDIGAPADGPGEQGDATREKGYLAYYEICEKIKNEGWNVDNSHSDAMGPYAYKGNQWVGYDDENIVRLKSKYVNEMDLGGIMFWSIDNDDFRGKCHGKPYPLIEAAKEALLADANELLPSTSTESKTKTTSNQSRKSESTGGKRKSRLRGKSSTSTETSRGKGGRATTTTPQPPTTPDPGSDFMCKDEGFFPHPRDCKKYFWCLDSGPSSLGIVAHQFTCPSGLVFNKISDSCDYARNVICKNKLETSSTSPSSTTTTTTTTTTPRTTTAKSRVITASPPRTTTPFTTTTTAKPEEEYEEYEEDEEEDPGTIKELINLIKKLGGVEQLEKQLNIQGNDDKTKIKPSLYSKVLKGRTGNRYRGVTQETSTSKYVTVFRNRPNVPQSPGSSEFSGEDTRSGEKPRYVTIQRNRSKQQESDEEEEVEEEDERTESGEDNRSSRKPIDRRRKRPSTDVTTEREYVTLRRSRPVKEETTTSKYRNIVRTRSTTQATVYRGGEEEEEEEEEEGEEDGEDETDESEEEVVVEEKEPVQKQKKYSSIIRDNKRIVTEVEESKVSGDKGPQKEATPEESKQPNRGNTTVNSVNKVSTPKYVKIRRGQSNVKIEGVASDVNNVNSSIVSGYLLKTVDSNRGSDNEIETRRLSRQGEGIIPNQDSNESQQKRYRILAGQRPTIASLIAENSQEDMSSASEVFTIVVPDPTAPTVSENDISQDKFIITVTPRTENKTETNSVGQSVFETTTAGTTPTSTETTVVTSATETVTERRKISRKKTARERSTTTTTTTTVKPETTYRRFRTTIRPSSTTPTTTTKAPVRGFQFRVRPTSVPTTEATTEKRFVPKRGRRPFPNPKVDEAEEKKEEKPTRFQPRKPRPPSQESNTQDRTTPGTVQRTPPRRPIFPPLRTKFDLETQQSGSFFKNGQNENNVVKVNEVKIVPGRNRFLPGVSQKPSPVDEAREDDEDFRSEEEEGYDSQEDIGSEEEENEYNQLFGRPNTDNNIPEEEDNSSEEEEESSKEEVRPGRIQSINDRFFKGRIRPTFDIPDTVRSKNRFTQDNENDLKSVVLPDKERFGFQFPIDEEESEEEGEEGEDEKHQDAPSDKPEKKLGGRVTLESNVQQRLRNQTRDGSGNTLRPRRPFKRPGATSDSTLENEGPQTNQFQTPRFRNHLLKGVNETDKERQTDKVTTTYRQRNQFLNRVTPRTNGTVAEPTSHAPTDGVGTGSFQPATRVRDQGFNKVNLQVNDTLIEPTTTTEIENSSGSKLTTRGRNHLFNVNATTTGPTASVSSETVSTSVFRPTTRGRNQLFNRVTENATEPAISTTTDGTSGFTPTTKGRNQPFNRVVNDTTVEPTPSASVESEINEPTTRNQPLAHVNRTSVEPTSSTLTKVTTLWGRTQPFNRITPQPNTTEPSIQNRNQLFSRGNSSRPGAHLGFNRTDNKQVELSRLPTIEEEKVIETEERSKQEESVQENILDGEEESRNVSNNVRQRTRVLQRRPLLKKRVRPTQEGGSIKALTEKLEDKSEENKEEKPKQQAEEVTKGKTEGTDGTIKKIEDKAQKEYEEGELSNEILDTKGKNRTRILLRKKIGSRIEADADGRNVSGRTFVRFGNGTRPLVRKIIKQEVKKPVENTVPTTADTLGVKNEESNSNRTRVILKKKLRTRENITETDGHFLPEIETEGRNRTRIQLKNVTKKAEQEVAVEESQKEGDKGNRTRILLRKRVGNRTKANEISNADDQLGAEAGRVIPSPFNSLYESGGGKDAQYNYSSAAKAEEQEEEEDEEEESRVAGKKVSTVFRKRVTTTTTAPEPTEDVDGSEVPPSTTTTTTRTGSNFIRRGNQEFILKRRNKLTTTSKTTETPTTSEAPKRKTVITERRRFRPESRTPPPKPEVETETTVTSSIRQTPFTRRRIRPKNYSTTTTTEASKQEDSKLEESQDSIPDLADPAVVAIHNLATVSPVPVVPVSPTPTTSVGPVRFSPATPSGFSIQYTPVTITEAPHSPSRSTINLFTRQPSSIRTFIPAEEHKLSTILPLRTTAIRVKPPLFTTEDTYVPLGQVSSHQPRRPTTQKPRAFTAPVQTKEQEKPKKPKPFTKVQKRPSAVIETDDETQPFDYQVYDDVDEDPLANVPASALKVKVHSDGYIECLDRGNFPHPFSCKKFISCARMENNELLGWEYTCPKHLSFDPVGGICNWSAGLGCQH